MINLVRDTVHYEMNKENKGYLTPDQFNAYSTAAQLEIFDSYKERHSQAIFRRNNRRHNTGLGDIPRYIEEVLDSLRVESVLTWSNIGTAYALPTDCYHLDAVYYNGVELDYTTASKAKASSLLLDVAPSADFPVYYYANINDNINFPTQTKAIKVLPTSLEGVSIVADYVRYPKDPNWTYTSLAGGEPVFNQTSDYQDFELPKEEFPNLVNRILMRAGLSIREIPVITTATNREIEEKQDER